MMTRIISCWKITPTKEIEEIYILKRREWVEQLRQKWKRGILFSHIPIRMYNLGYQGYKLVEFCKLHEPENVFVKSLFSIDEQYTFHGSVFLVRFPSNSIDNSDSDTDNSDSDTDNNEKDQDMYPRSISYKNVQCLIRERELQKNSSESSHFFPEDLVSLLNG